MYHEYIEKLQSIVLFEDMKKEEIERVLGCLQAHLGRYKKDEYLYIQGNAFQNIGIILEGRISVNREYHNGSVQVLDTLGEGDTFGEDVVCLNQNHAPYSLVTTMNTLVLFINGKKLIEPSSAKCEYRSRVNLNMLKRMARYSVYVNHKMKYMSILSLKKRVIAYLLDCYEESGTANFKIGMNREQMAHYLNGTRPSISKILMELKKENLIDYHKDCFTIYEEEALIKKMDL